MSRSFLRCVVLTVTFFASAEHARSQAYSILDLGPLYAPGGDNFGFVSGINDRGQVIGSVGYGPMGDSYYYGFKTAPGLPIDLSTDNLGQPLGRSTIPTAINNLGQIVGYSYDPGANRNIYFRTMPNGSINPDTDLIGTQIVNVNAINASGQVVGAAYLSNWGVIGIRTAPNATLNPETDALSGGSFLSVGSGINDAGQVVGVCGYAQGTDMAAHIFRTAPNKSIDLSTDDLGSLGWIGGSPNASAINNIGQVAGNSNISSSQTHAFLTGPNKPINPSTDDIGTLGGDSSWAKALNNRGVVVGESYITNNAGVNAFVYTKSKGLQDLRSLVVGAHGWNLTSANGINSQGQIAGSGTYNGQVHGYVLTPTIVMQATTEVPSPSLIARNVPTSDQLKVYSGGHFVTANGSNIDSSKPTVVITHGYTADSTAPWISDIAEKVTSSNGVNIIAWDWGKFAGNSNPWTLGDAYSRTPSQGEGLGSNLLQILGPNYSQPIHFIGHSLGTLVNAEAVNTMHKNGFDSGDNQVQVTIFDDAEVAANFDTRDHSNLLVSAVPKGNRALYIDNYISSFGQIHDGSNVTNVVLTKMGEDVIPGRKWILFHSYPQTWYSLTMDDKLGSSVGYRWSVENGSVNGSEPRGQYFLQSQNPNDSEITAVMITNDLADSIVSLRKKETKQEIAIKAFLAVDSIRSSVNYAGNVAVTAEERVVQSFESIVEGVILMPIFKLTEGSPAYAWVPVTVPESAQAMTLDFVFNGMSQDDLFVVGIDDKRLFSIEGAYAESGSVYSTGLLDVTEWSGRDIQLFLGLSSDEIAGGSIDVSGISFVTIPEPSVMLMVLFFVSLLFFSMRPKRC